MLKAELHGTEQVRITTSQAALAVWDGPETLEKTTAEPAEDLSDVKGTVRRLPLRPSDAQHTLTLSVCLHY